MMDICLIEVLENMLNMLCRHAVTCIRDPEHKGIGTRCGRIARNVPVFVNRHR